MKKLLKVYSNLPPQIYMLFVGMIIFGSGNLVYPIITLIFTQKYGFDEKLLSYIIAFSGLIQVPILLVGGKLADRIGKRKFLSIIFLYGFIIYAICIVTQNPKIIVILIITVVGVISLLTPLINAIISDYTEKTGRSKAYSLIYFASNIGAAIAPILAGALFNNYFQFIFLGNSISLLLCFIIFAFCINRFKREEEIKGDIEDTVGLKEVGEEQEYKNIISVLKAKPVIIAIAISIFIFQLANSQYGYLLPLNCIKVFNDKGAATYGFLAGIDGISLIIMTPILTQWFHKKNPLKLIMLGGISFIIAFFLFGKSNNLILFSISMFFLSIGEIIIYTNYNIVIANYAPAKFKARLTTLLAVITGSGYMAGPIIVGQLSFLSFQLRWWFVAVLLLIPVIILFKCSKSEKNK